VGAPVVDIPSITAVFDKTGRTQHPEVLGDGALPQTQRSLQVADTLLSIAQHAEDRDARRMTEGAKQAGLILVDSKNPV
jgi:hypothetical protein